LSAHQEHPSHAEKYGHQDGFDVHHHDHMPDHGSLKSYTIGFVLAVILTAIPFWLVMNKVITDSATAGLVLLGLAAVQVVVHMVYFLYMNGKSEGGWTILALIFTLVLVVILLAGSLWVMFHMNHNMMPGMNPDMLREVVPASLQNMPGMKQ
jgi:cytochrome o ubiquinol oxidase operon protein cyoD